MTDCRPVSPCDAGHFNKINQRIISPLFIYMSVSISFPLLFAQVWCLCNFYFLHLHNETNLVCWERKAGPRRATDGSTEGGAHGAVGGGTRNAGGGIKLMRHTEGRGLEPDDYRGWIHIKQTIGFSTFRDLFGVGVHRNLRLVGVRTAVPYSMSSSVCLLFLSCC